MKSPACARAETSKFSTRIISSERRWVAGPSAQDALTVALVANEKALERRVIEPERATRAQRLNGFDEDEIRGAGAIARRSRVGHDRKNTRLKMGGGLEPDGRGPGGGILSSGRHRADLIENDVVVFARRDLGPRCAESGKHQNDDSEKLSHGSADTDKT